MDLGAKSIEFTYQNGSKMTALDDLSLTSGREIPKTY